MKKLYVYADFDWLKEVELIGELGYESLRGVDSYNFTFNNEWLRQHSDLFLSDDLNNYPGQQYTQPGKDIFGCFSDALPDRWGRTLLLRREQIVAAEEQRPVRRLSSFDFLTGIDDFSRMGNTSISRTVCCQLTMRHFMRQTLRKFYSLPPACIFQGLINSR